MPRRWFERDGRGDERGVLPAYLFVVLITIVVTSANIANVVHDSARFGAQMLVATAATLEYSSAAGLIAAAWIPALAMRLIPFDRLRWWQAIIGHGIGSLLFSAAHLGIMTTLRELLFGWTGHLYALPHGFIPYEYRKDLLTYLFMAGIFWSSATLVARRRIAGSLSSADAEPTFDIADGARIHRTPIDSIIAVRARGNYVEFALVSHRNYLMRTTLADVATTLTASGFLRLHRSWLVNPRHVRMIEAAGHGDYRVLLNSEIELTASRRFREAIARLKGTVPPPSAKVKKAMAEAV